MNNGGLMTRGGAAAGIVAPPLYFSLVLILGVLEPGFSHRTEMMSQLGGIPGIRGAVFNLGVGATGALLIFFALGLQRQLAEHWTRSVGTALLSLGGIGFIGAALFPCTEGCTNIFAEPTLGGRIHIAMALFGGMGSGLAPLFFWGAMRQSPAWRGFASTTLAAAVLANLPGIFFWVTIASGFRLSAVEGYIQRAGFMVVLIWIFATALQLRKLVRRIPSSIKPS